MADKETTKLIVEAIEFYLGAQRNLLNPDASIDQLKKIVRLEEIKTSLLAKKDE